MTRVFRALLRRTRRHTRGLEEGTEGGAVGAPCPSEIELASEEIAAPPELVWRILIDFAAYPEWNPFITAIEGRSRWRSRLRVHMAPPGRAAVTLRPRLRRPQRPFELRWSGEVLAPGLLDGELVIEIQPLATGRCRIRELNRATGVLAPFLREGLIEISRAGFMAMNRALKGRAEGAEEGSARK